MDKKGIISIDPGASGGIALITDNYSFASKCPKSTWEMYCEYDYYISTCFAKKLKPIVAIEKVWAFPTDARSNAFNFGVNYGKWLGIIAQSSIKPILVLPKIWQEAYQPLSKDKKIRKKELKTIAEEMFSKIRVTLYNCDALLIGAYIKKGEEINE